MNQITPSADRPEAALRRGTTTLTRRRGQVVVQIHGVPTYQDDETGESMIPGPLAVRLDDAMLAILDSIERDGELPIGIQADS